MPRKQGGRKPRVGKVGYAMLKAGRRGKKTIETTEWDMRHVAAVQADAPKDAGKHLNSVVDENELQEFLSDALLSQTSFEAEKSKVLVCGKEEARMMKEVDKHPELYDYEKVDIPLRPPWDETTTPDELEDNERQSFLVWRRRLAEMEENSSMRITPFEKNFEVWRQLWRVLERSDVVCQIVDARNPLLFRCKSLPDAIKHAAENIHGRNKAIVLIINKSDYLSAFMRNVWATYFHKKKIEFVFFSALEENIKQELQESVPCINKPSTVAISTTKVLGGEELLQLFKQIGESSLSSKERQKRMGPTGTRVVVGMVGYPNVGKSSTINVLMGAKKVTVSATPGKTKHFQTLLVNKDIAFCDCPGLIFPTFMNSKADLIINGILPIDQLRDGTPAVDLLCKRIGLDQFKAAYNLSFPEYSFPLPARVLLGKYSRMRSFWVDHGRPDNSKSARIILKDFVNGKLIYAHPPPNLTSQEKIAFANSLVIVHRKKQREQRQQQMALSLTTTTTTTTSTTSTTTTTTTTTTAAVTATTTATSTTTTTSAVTTTATTKTTIQSSNFSELKFGLSVIEGKAGIVVDADMSGFEITGISNECQPYLREGDLIVAINGESLTGKSNDEQARVWKQHLRNAVEVTVHRNNKNPTLNFLGNREELLPVGEAGRAEVLREVVPDTLMKSMFVPTPKPKPLTKRALRKQMRKMRGKGPKIKGRKKYAGINPYDSQAHIKKASKEN